MSFTVSITADTEEELMTIGAALFNVGPEERKPWTKADDAKLAELVVAGQPHRTIAQMMRRHYRGVTNRVAKLDLSRPPPG